MGPQAACGRPNAQVGGGVYELDICEEHLAGQYRIEVIDLLAHPQLARDDQIIAIPTLVRKLPEPVRTIIEDLSNTERVLVGLDLRPHRP